MANLIFTMPGDNEDWCSTTRTFLHSKPFGKFLEIYNAHDAGTRANKAPATVDDVLKNRNLRNEMRAFYRDRLKIMINGAVQAKKLTQLSGMVDRAIEILAQRDTEVARDDGEGDDKAYKLLDKSILI